MSILDFNKGPATTERRQDQTRPEAKVWLNLGYEANGRFVNLPLGLPIDTMEPVKVNGSEEWAQFQTARNNLLKALQGAGDKLQPGEEQEVRMIIKIRRVNEHTEVDAGDFSTDLSALFAAS